jgi:malonyl-CoA O-methyltransferase
LPHCPARADHRTSVAVRRHSVTAQIDCNSPDLRQHTAIVTTNRYPGALNSDDVRRRFDRAARRFDGADFVHRQAAAGLFERMSPMLLDVQRILDAGAGAGRASRELAAKFRSGRVISLDLSFEMLRQAKRNRRRFARITELQANASRLPLLTGSIDLVFANLLLPWCDDIPALFAEVGRVVRKDGLFVFSSLGPDSLQELRQAWSAVDPHEHVNAFVDMHDLGDTLLRAGFREPVLDVDYLTVLYRDLQALFRDMTACGARNCLEGRPRTLTGKGRFGAMCGLLEQRFSEGTLPLRLELVFGHAWGGGTQYPGEYRLDVSAIGRRR